MRRLGDELGIRAPSLYKHVAGKEQVEAALQQRALEQLGAGLEASDGGLAAFAAAYRRWALAHPRLYELATRRPLDREAIDRRVEDAVAERLVAAVGGDRAVARAAWAACHGLVDLELAGRFPPGADIDAAWAATVAAYDAARARS